MRLAKKTLVVSSWAPPTVGGSPRLLYNFFSRFDSNTYCLLTNKRKLPADGQQTFTARLGCNYYFYDSGKIFTYKLFPKTFTKDTSFLEKGFALLRRIVLHGMRNIGIIRNGLRVIKTENIEVLLGMSDNGPALLLTLVLSKLSRKPYVLYLFDIYSRNDFGRLWNLVARTFEPILLRGASNIIILNDAVKESYQEKYKAHNFEVIRNSGSMEADRPFVPRPYSPNDSYTILYTGSIYWLQEGALQNLLETLTLIKSPRVNVRFTCPLTKTLKIFIEQNGLTDRVLIQAVTDDELTILQNAADILFVPESWDTPSPETIITVFPQKLVEYNASGKPILVHAPTFSYVTRYAKENKLALVIDENNVEKLKEGILNILKDQNYAAELVQNAKTTFFKYHNIDKNTETLKKILDEV